MFRFFARIAQTYSIPVFKSFFKAYKDTTTGPRASSQSSSNSGKKHPLDQLFKKFLSQKNLSAPPLDYVTALKILNIQQKQGDKPLEPRSVLQRYYALYKKNDPQNGGTAYLQSKIFCAKQTIMNQFPNAVQVEQQFYKEVVEPEQKAQQQKKQKQKEQQEVKGQIDKQSKQKLKQNEKQKKQ